MPPSFPTSNSGKSQSSASRAVAQPGLAGQSLDLSFPERSLLFPLSACCTCKRSSCKGDCERRNLLTSVEGGAVPKTGAIGQALAKFPVTPSHPVLRNLACSCLFLTWSLPPTLHPRKRSRLPASQLLPCPRGLNEFCIDLKNTC